MVRGIPLFHRPKEDLLAQKLALVPELRLLPCPGLEVTWASAFAIQDREGTRAELPHAEAAQELRVRRRLPLAPDLTLLPAAAALVSAQEEGSLRGEVSATLAWLPGPVEAEVQLLHHQAALGEDPGDVALTYGHLQVHRPFRPACWLLLPLARASLEARTLSPADHPAWTLQTGLLLAWTPGLVPLRLLLATQAWYRGDLEEWTTDVSVGLQGTLGGDE